MWSLTYYGLIDCNCIRCFEEGAEEFFLKPVQQSDVNKLKPHLLKSRVKEEHEQTTHQQ